MQLDRTYISEKQNVSISEQFQVHEICYTQILCTLEDKLATPLRHIFNNSVSSGIFPEDWKSGNITSIIIIIIIIKPSSTGPSGKNKVVGKLFSNPTSTCETENWRKRNAVKQPTADCTLEPIQLSGVKNSVGKVIPQSNLSRQERPSKLGRSTPWYVKLQRMFEAGISRKEAGRTWQLQTYMLVFNSIQVHGVISYC